MLAYPTLVPVLRNTYVTSGVKHLLKLQLPGVYAIYFSYQTPVALLDMLPLPKLYVNDTTWYNNRSKRRDHTNNILTDALYVTNIRDYNALPPQVIETQQFITKLSSLMALVRAVPCNTDGAANGGTDRNGIEAGAARRRVVI